MAINLTDLRASIEAFREKGFDFFEKVDYASDGPEGFGPYNDRNFYWSKLEPEDAELGEGLRRELLSSIEKLANSIRSASLVTEADRRDLSVWAKTLRASLRLRRYASWDSEVLHDEGTVLGVKPSGQSEDDPLEPKHAKRIFGRNIGNLLGLLELLVASPAVGDGIPERNPQVTANYEPGTAFVMMRIDPGEPELEDIYEAIKSCFLEFGIKAVRADEIEHEEMITARIIREIEKAEFLLADLTGERPSVYYEVGYAHSLNRRVMLFRKTRTPVHFDLAAYNCPEYKNATELRKRLRTRLEAVTGRIAKNDGSQRKTDG